MFKQIIKLILIWRLSLWAAAFLAIFIIPLRAEFTSLTNGFSYPALIDMWHNFDGGYYLFLSYLGYGYNFSQNLYGFFPLYPFLIFSLNFLSDVRITALLISHASFFAALFVLYKLIHLDYSQKTAYTTILLLLLFPTSFFFGAVYSESLFLLLTLSCFYLARKKLFLLASLLALLATITRFAGIFIWPALVVELYLTHHKQIKKMLLDPSLIFVALIPPLGLLSFLRFQYLKTGDYFFFLNFRLDAATNPVVDKLVLIHQIFYRYIKMFIFVDHLSPLFFTVLLELLVGLGFLILIFFAFKKTRTSYAVFALFSYLLPTVGGTFSFLPRYALILFPAFITAAIYYNKMPKKFQVAYIIASVIFSLVAVSLFTRGYFIA